MEAATLHLVQKAKFLAVSFVDFENVSDHDHEEASISGCVTKYARHCDVGLET